jgi:uncharacterized membrane protein
MSSEEKPAASLWSFAATGLLASQVALAAWIGAFGPPGPLPMHFNLDGQVDRLGSRWEAVALLAAFALVVLILLLVRDRLARRVEARGQSLRTLNLAMGLALLPLAGVTLLLGAQGLGKMTGGAEGLGGLRATFIGVWLVLVVLGAVLGKLSPNPIVGVRLYWTRHSRLAWDKANRLLGRIFLIGGVFGLVTAPALDMRQNILLLLVVAGGGGLISIVESWRVWRADPERT